MKKLLILSIFALSISKVNAQAFVSAPVGISISSYKNDLSSANVSTFNFNISPRINVLEFNDNFSLSAGTHIEVGYVLNSDNLYAFDPEFQFVEVEKKKNFLINIPLVAELNFGLGSTENTDGEVGFYIGGGVSGYKIINYSDFEFAPTVSAGARLGFANFQLGYVTGASDQIWSFGVTTNLD